MTDPFPTNHANATSGSLTTGERVSSLAHDFGVFRALTARGMIRMRRRPPIPTKIEVDVTSN